MSCWAVGRAAMEKAFVVSCREPEIFMNLLLILLLYFSKFGRPFATVRETF
jgi:hypothetical protein